MSRIVIRLNSRPNSRLGWLLVLALAVASQVTSPVLAQRASAGRNTSATLSAFKEVVARPSESTVRVLCEGEATALGAIVSNDGYIVTKASDLRGKIVCKLRDGKEYAARIVGVEDKHDLAMLKIDPANSLRAIEWVSTKAEVGDWVASAADGDTPAAVGVLSVAARKPNPRENGPAAPLPTSGFLGIQLRPDDDGSPVVDMVTKGSAAEKAGLKTGDIVLSVAGRKVTSPDRLIEVVQRFKVGDNVVLKVRRGEDEKELKAVLGRRPADQFSRGDRMNQMGSELSRKRTGFPVILQHDTVIKPKDCGGPLVNLEGKAVGINIARAGRTESYAIPADAVVALLPALRSGKLAPREDNTDKIAELEKSIRDLRKDLKKIEGELADLDGEGDGEKVKEKRDALASRKAELARKIAQGQTALDKLRKDPTKKPD